MPWNSNNGGGGPWQPKGQGPRNPNPWGGGPSGGGGGGGGGREPPDLEEILRRSQDKLRRVIPGGGGGEGGFGRLGGLGIAILAVLGIIGWGLTGFYTVRPNEVGIERVFGQFTSLTAPGLNWNWPYPVGRIDRPTIGVQTVEIGLRTGQGGRGSRDVREESLMLTGDENIVDVDFTVLWLVDARRPQDFIFNLRNPEGTVKAVAESAMRDVIGRRDIQPILTGARLEIERQVQELMQRTLNSYGAGIVIQQVQMLKVDPPNEVIDAFRDVQAARADQERAQNEAQTYANRVIPEARGEASRITQRAEAERERMIADARGEATRFNAILDEYQKAPDVTRQRLYLETIERVFGGMEKVIVDTGQRQQGGVVPLLPLNDLMRSRIQDQGKR
ncbi:MAG: FtsH protease activity modulator HflK [Methylobacterium sp.]|nr:FtsH protease activity modulator HflK [Rhodobacter sp.]MCA3655999.1 FtsH protease activity modulator HflK [Methylobacterium sp.]MCA3657566.1 FtsH protease activity modulator HflK [Methylobacterium sp.]MCA3661597.1 FtsH protease activity modulator HflK [Methylobacterium sp.]MCA3664762.1 FtsH protease activity modulator HflK [Methylobacterium sp.]